MMARMRTNRIATANRQSSNTIVLQRIPHSSSARVL